MAHVAFLCPPLPGHINPMAVLARELIGRGHSVTFVGFPDMRDQLAGDLVFESFGEEDQPAGSLRPYMKRLSRMGALRGVQGLIRDLARFADTTCRSLPGELHRLHPDALIIDQTDLAASLVARAMQIPFANVANALPMNTEPAIPPPVLPWRFDRSPRGIRRNAGGYRVAQFIEQPITRVLRRHAERFGLTGFRDPEDSWSDLCQITQCVRGLDFPREQLPKVFHYVGPLREPEPPLGFELPDESAPLLFCSLGSLQGSRAHVFHAVARAAADLRCNLLIAHGGLLSKAQIARLPGHPLIKAFVPQRAVLARSAVAVTHAGFNTVMDALSCATPMVAMPIAFEQPGTAARLERVGVAEVLRRRRSPRHVRDALERVLGSRSYGENARRLSQEIAKAGGVTRAADLLETALGLCARPATSTTARMA